jgi:hypothetical protein
LGVRWWTGRIRVEGGRRKGDGIDRTGVADKAARCRRLG